MKDSDTQKYKKFSNSESERNISANFHVQWNLRIKDTLGQRVLSFIERCPLFRG